MRVEREDSKVRSKRTETTTVYSTISREFTPAAASVVGVPTSGVEVPVAFPLAAAVFFFFFFLFLDEDTGGRVRISTPVSVILKCQRLSTITQVYSQDGFFELGRVPPVESYCCPVISPMVQVGSTKVDHWFLLSAQAYTRRIWRLTIVNTCPASIRPGVFDPP
jgi:hypothetical protein